MTALDAVAAYMLGMGVAYVITALWPEPDNDYGLAASVSIVFAVVFVALGHLSLGWR